jgi:serine/threonine protein kinase
MEMDLSTYIRSFPKGLPLDLIKNILKQILKGLSYVHNEGILHRDLKPQNILLNIVNNSIEVKIADFGLARTYYKNNRNLTKYTSKENLTLVTPLYRAPEIFNGSSNYTTAIDMWSVGCIFAELVKGNPLFSGEIEIDIVNMIYKLLGTPMGVSGFPTYSGKNLSEIFPVLDNDGIDLISKMLVYDAKLRISASQALEHRFFN